MTIGAEANAAASPVLTDGGQARHGDGELDAVYRKVAVRLMPLLGLCYLAAYVDRVNVGFAKLQMAQQLELSDLAYGFGAGIFFIGYFLFEVPSNLILHRVGARAWLSRIMVTWAIVSGATAALGPIHAWWGANAAGYAFYAIRFLLGAAEAGFFPGVLLYLTYWYPPSRRSLAMGQFLLAQPAAFVLGAPISGFILARTDGVAGLAGWQWMYILEAAPAGVLAIALLRLLPDGFERVVWLSDRERALLSGAIEAERVQVADAKLRDLPRNATLRLLTLAYFLLVLGAYGLNFWLPSIVKLAGIASDVGIGLLTALPYSVAVVVMLSLAQRSRDIRHARTRAAWACGIAAVGLATSAISTGHLWLMMCGMTLGISGYLAGNALFWRLPGELFEGRALAAGLAAVNAVGNLGGFVGPYLVGAIVQAGGGPKYALFGLAGALASAGVVLAVARDRHGSDNPGRNSVTRR